MAIQHLPIGYMQNLFRFVGVNIGLLTIIMIVST